MYHIYWTLQTFWKERWRSKQKWLLPLNINTTILKSKFLSWITWIDPSLLIYWGISETPKFLMDYSFHSGILLGDAHSKHILIILLIVSWQFRKLQKCFPEFDWDKDRTQNRKSNSLLIKRWNFRRISILKPQNSMPWARGNTNERMLLCF